MMISYYTLGVLLAVASSYAVSIAPRSIHRSGRAGDVSLVEFAIRSTIHGRCSYTDKIGRAVKLIYEDTKGKIIAKSSNPSVVDEGAAVRECRAAAVELPQVDEHEGRADDSISSFSPYEIKARFNEFSQASYENQRYVQQLQPRFLTWIGDNFGLGKLGNLGNLGSFANSFPVKNNFGLSWGNTGTSGFHDKIPGINLMGPNEVQSQNTVTHGHSNHFNHNNANTGPWGVLNSLHNNNQGGFFGGFPSFFSWLNPFSFLGGNIIR